MLFFKAGERRHLRMPKQKKKLSQVYLIIIFVGISKCCIFWYFQIESLWFCLFPSSALFLQNVSKIEKNPTKRAGANLAPKGPEKDHEILAKQHLGHPMNGSSLIKMAPEDIWAMLPLGLGKGDEGKKRELALSSSLSGGLAASSPPNQLAETAKRVDNLRRRLLLPKST